MLDKYNVIYSILYYPRFHVTAVGLGTYYLWIRGSACTFKGSDYMSLKNTMTS